MLNGLLEKGVADVEAAAGFEIVFLNGPGRVGGLLEGGYGSFQVAFPVQGVASIEVDLRKLGGGFHRLIVVF
jgi:hypothetical protein